MQIIGNECWEISLILLYYHNKKQICLQETEAAQAWNTRALKVLKQGSRMEKKAFIHRKMQISQGMKCYLISEKTSPCVATLQKQHKQQ